jgi:hypothetical protein
MMRRVCILAAALLVAGGGVTRAQDSSLPLPLHTNEADIGEALQRGAVAVDDPLAVFDYVLGRLPARVRVYPTENYFYFRFTASGVTYAGNIRLAAADRDRGKVDFSYNEKPTDWNAEPPNYHAMLGEEQGVTVDKVGPLLYRVTRSGKSVEFALNDLSQIRPPRGALKSDEEFLGPVFDESGMRFFLVFNRRLKVFHFLLDETVPPSGRFAPLKGTRIEVGKRTGFAFYPFDGRKVLVGVDARQSRLNTAFDGPFDQLPENFIKGEALREAILAADPSVRGEIDRLGNFTDGSGRYLIHPYMLYRQVGDLAVFERCAKARTVAKAAKPLCFVIDNEEAQRRHPRPLALKRR